MSWTQAAAPALVPEVRMHLARELYDLWERSGALPYWAFAWPGGQALARYVLDHPSLVAGRRVLDVGTGGGLVAIAAGLAGARSLRGSDVDPLALDALHRNAALNGVEVAAELGDLLDGQGEPADAVLVGDLLYEAGTAPRVVAFAERCAARGADVLVGDPGRTYLPKGAWHALASYDVPVPTLIESAPVRTTTVWRVPQSRS